MHLRARAIVQVFTPPLSSSISSCSLPRSRPLVCVFVPRESAHRLRVTWALPPLLRWHAERPCDLIGHILGHEARGSVLHALQVRGFDCTLGLWGISHRVLGVTACLTADLSPPPRARCSSAGPRVGVVSRGGRRLGRGRLLQLHVHAPHRVDRRDPSGPGPLEERRRAAAGGGAARALRRRPSPGLRGWACGSRACPGRG